MARQETGRFLAALAAATLLAGAAPGDRLEEAVSAQRALVEEHPADAGALNDLGNLLVELGDLGAAEEAYRRAIEADAGRAEPRFNLALLLTASDRHRQARRELQELLRDHPDHAWGHYQMGILQAARNSRGRALESYREAFRIDPSLADPRVNPHIVENEMATAAMLEAFSRLGAKSTTPRVYSDPSRITGLLLPRLTGEPAAVETEDEAESPPEMESKPEMEGEEPGEPETEDEPPGRRVREPLKKADPDG